MYITPFTKFLPSWNFLVQSPHWKYQNNKWNFQPLTFFVKKLDLRCLIGFLVRFWLLYYKLAIHTCTRLSFHSLSGLSINIFILRWSKCSLIKLLKSNQKLLEDCFFFSGLAVWEHLWSLLLCIAEAIGGKSCSFITQRIKGFCFSKTYT